MSNCKTCKYWKQKDETQKFAPCDRVPMGPFDRDYESEDIHDELAFVEDGSDYYAKFITAADFGCVLHEVKVP